MKRRRVNWPYGNPAFGAWLFETPDKLVVARRNHPVVRRGQRLCQGWDIWLDGVDLGDNDWVRLIEHEMRYGQAAAQKACCGVALTFEKWFKRSLAKLPAPAKVIQ